MSTQKSAKTHSPSKSLPFIFLQTQHLCKHFNLHQFLVNYFISTHQILDHRQTWMLQIIRFFHHWNKWLHVGKLNCSVNESVCWHKWVRWIVGCLMLLLGFRLFGVVTFFSFWLWWLFYLRCLYVDGLLACHSRWPDRLSFPDQFFCYF